MRILSSKYYMQYIVKIFIKQSRRLPGLPVIWPHVEHLLQYKLYIIFNFRLYLYNWNYCYMSYGKFMKLLNCTN